MGRKTNCAFAWHKLTFGLHFEGFEPLLLCIKLTFAWHLLGTASHTVKKAPPTNAAQDGHQTRPCKPIKNTRIMRPRAYKRPRESLPMKHP